MKRLVYPYADFYRHEELANELEIPVWKVIRACETGQLKAEFVPEKIETKNTYTPRSRGTVEITGHTRYKRPAYYKIPLSSVLAWIDGLLPTEHSNTHIKKTAKDINPKEKDTLLKLIAVMALNGYGFDSNQERSPIPAEIVRAADEVGITLDPKTVRKWLKIACNQHVNGHDDVSV